MTEVLLCKYCGAVPVPKEGACGHCQARLVLDTANKKCAKIQKNASQRIEKLMNRIQEINSQTQKEIENIRRECDAQIPNCYDPTVLHPQYDFHNFLKV